MVKREGVIIKGAKREKKKRERRKDKKKKYMKEEKDKKHGSLNLRVMTHVASEKNGRS